MEREERGRRRGKERPYLLCLTMVTLIQILLNLDVAEEKVKSLEKFSRETKMETFESLHLLFQEFLMTL